MDKIVKSLKNIWEGWKRVAKVIGKVQTRILLFIIYFIFVGPTALVMRLLGKDLLDKRLEPNASTYWKPYPKHDRSEETYKHEF